MAAAAALSLGIKLGQESGRLKSGEIDSREFKKRTGSHVGMVGGTLTGAAVGTVIGRLWPVGGTILGAFMGGMVGQMWGEQAGRAAAERLDNAWQTKPSSPPKPKPDPEVHPVESDSVSPARNRDL